MSETKQRGPRPAQVDPRVLCPWSLARPWAAGRIVAWCLAAGSWCSLAIGAPAPIHAQDWLQWGGAGRDFRVKSDVRLATHWPKDGPPVVYERALGSGYSAVLVAGDRLYTGYHDGTHEAIVALDAASGQTLWQRPIASQYRESHVLQFGKGPNATPLVVGDRLFAVSFGGRAYALDTADGRVLWQRDLVADFGATVQQFGYAAAPIAESDPARGDFVILPLGGEQHGAVGLRQADGRAVWTTPPFAVSYASPMAIDVEGERQLVFMAPTEVLAVRLADGAIRWRHPHANRFRVNCAMPVWNAAHQTLFVTSQADAGSRVLHLAHREGGMRVDQLTVAPRVKMFHNDAILMGDVIYGASDSMLVAYDLSRGAILWRERGYPEARLVEAGGRGFLLDENGMLSLATLSPAGVTLHGRMQVLEKPAWTPPTLAGGRLYLRDTRKLVVLDVAAARAAKRPQR